ncbi:MAG: hypothetical protein KJO31_18530 [Gammaproteobacteria bacterium]|nr:hypothetical protein [Gammaproteobacteria bacterium]
MILRAIIATAMITLSLTASADFTTVERAYEVPLSTFNVPVTHNGVISFKECDDCNAVSARMTNNTHLVVNGKFVTLKDFRAEAFQVRDRSSTFLTILHHLESDTVTSISLTR